jgi:hypothetical protein
MIDKNFIERSFLHHYSEGKKDEFFLTDRTHNLPFLGLKDENPKKIKDVAVSLVRAGFLRGDIQNDKTGIVVTTKGITAEGVKYLKTIS